MDTTDMLLSLVIAYYSFRLGEIYGITQSCEIVNQSLKTK